MGLDLYNARHTWPLLSFCDLMASNSDSYRAVEKVLAREVNKVLSKIGRRRTRNHSPVSSSDEFHPSCGRDSRSTCGPSLAK